MRKYYLTSAALFIALGAGCWRTTAPYIKAPPSPSIEVKPNIEGSKASTGGAEATITPALATELLVKSLPEPKSPWTAEAPAETKLPAPLPDGTRTEVTRVDREYVKGKDASKYVRISITDTRGLPVLLQFIQSFEASEHDAGFRKKTAVDSNEAWLTYTYGPNREADGTGSITLIYRSRFHIQLDGGSGISSAELIDLANAFTWKALE